VTGRCIEYRDISFRYRYINNYGLTIAPLTIVSEDQWGDLDCLYKACQAAITESGLFTDTAWVDERGENERTYDGTTE